MKQIILATILLQVLVVNAQSHKDNIIEFQNHLNEEYKNPEKSPLPKKEIRKFKGHDFFPINETYRVEAQFERVPNAVPFLMQTTTDRLPTYEVYGVATFELNGQEYQLNIYQGHATRQMPQYRDHLFLPFTDVTNGETTYGGGRFIDLKIPEGDVLVIDFNKAYNPYCAYSPRYSCPIPPKENDLPIAISAGIKMVKQ